MKTNIGIEQEVMYHLVLRSWVFLVRQACSEVLKIHTAEPEIQVTATLTKQFSEVFVPLRNLCINESLLLWKGRLLFKQYIPKKRNRFGINLFVLYDCKTRYILDFIVYTGDRSDITFEKEFGYTGSVTITIFR